MKMKTIQALMNAGAFESENLELSEVGRHPLFHPSQIQGILSNFNHVANQYPLGSIMPLVPRQVDKVKMDVELQIRGGMTPMVAVDSGTPIYGAQARAQREFEAAEFREKVRLVESDLYNFRKLGTESDLMDARTLLRVRYAPIEERLQNRLEWMRRSVLFDNEVRSSVHNGAPFSLTYKHPGYLRPALTGTDVWDDYLNSDPIGDMQDWVEDFVLHTGFSIDKVVLPLGMFKHLSRNERFREMAKQSYGDFNGGRAAIIQNILDLTGVGMIEEWTSALTFSVELAAGAASGQANIVLKHADELAAGDVITINKLATDERVRGTVAAVSGNTVTLTANLALALDAGDMVRYSKMIIPRNRILILGTQRGGLTTVGAESGPDQEFLNNWAELTSTLSRRSNFDQPSAGVFSQLMDNMDSDPPNLEQLIGIRALPNVFYHEAWMSPYVL